MANKYMKRCSTALVTKEMLIKTKMRYYFIPICIAVIKKTVTIVGKDVKKVETSYIIGKKVKLYSHLKKQNWLFLSKLSIDLLDDPIISHLGITKKKRKHMYIQRLVYKDAR